MVSRKHKKTLETRVVGVEDGGGRIEKGMQECSSSRCWERPCAVPIIENDNFGPIASSD